MAIGRSTISNHIDGIKFFLLKHYVLVLIILGPLILFGPMLLSGEVLFWGTPLMQFTPWRKFMIEVLSKGHIPLWNPLLGMGAPLIANYQSALFYPPNWILFLTGPAWGHGFLVFLHIIWTGLGMQLLVKQIGLSRLSQAIAALAFALSGYVIARAGFLSINATIAWLPWIILAVERLIFIQAEGGDRKRLIKPIALLGLMLAMQWLAGHAQSAWYCFLLVLIWSGWRGFKEGRGKGVIQAMLALGLSALVAFLLSAVQLLPTAEYLFHSHRASEVERELALAYSFWPWRILGLIMPNLFGNPASGNFWGYANYWEDAIYVGILPFLLAMFACIRGLRKSKFSNLIFLLLSLIVISFVMALGKNTPIFPFLYEYVPSFNLFQAPTRWTILLVFSLSLLAAIGAELWQTQELLRLFWVRLGTVGAAAAGVIGLLARGMVSAARESFLPAIVFAGLWLMLSGVIAWRRRVQPARLWPILIGCFVLIDLIWAAYGLNPSVPKELFEGKSELVEEVNADHRVYMPAEVEETIKFEWTHRFDTFYPDVGWDLVRDTGLPNTTMMDKIPSANNFDPILPNRYVQWIQSLDRVSEDKKEQMLAMMDVGWKALFDTKQEYGVLYQEIEEPERILFIGEVIWVSNGEEALALITDPDFSRLERVVIEGRPTDVGLTDPSGSEVMSIDQNNPNMLVIDVNATDACWMVLADTWYPGWQVRIDGQRVELYRANYIFRAVHLSLGEHRVEFHYQPLTFILGAGLSMISWIMIGILWWTLKQE